MKKRQGTALVTGASSGIGLELASCLARGGYDLVLVARNREKLKQVANTLSNRYNVRVLILVKDLSRPLAPQKIFEELQRANVQIDVLVNNAGLGIYGHFAEADGDQMLNVMQVNVAVLTHLIRLFLPQMLERGQGRVLNVASTAAFQPGPLMAVYFASKAFVLSLSEALSNETEGSGVFITCLCPGPTQSDFQNRAQMNRSKLSENNLMSATQVANAGYRAMMRGQTLIIPGNNNAFWAWFTRLLPRSTTPKIVRRVQDTKTSFVETSAPSSTQMLQVADNSSLDESDNDVSP